MGEEVDCRGGHALGSRSFLLLPQESCQGVAPYHTTTNLRWLGHLWTNFGKVLLAGCAFLQKPILDVSSKEALGNSLFLIY